MYDTQPRHYHKSYKQKPQIYKMLIQEKEVPTMNWDLFVWHSPSPATQIIHGYSAERF